MSESVATSLVTHNLVATISVAVLAWGGRASAVSPTPHETSVLGDLRLAVGGLGLLRFGREGGGTHL